MRKPTPMEIEHAPPASSSRSKNRCPNVYRAEHVRIPHQDPSIPAPSKATIETSASSRKRGRNQLQTHGFPVTSRPPAKPRRSFFLSPKQTGSSRHVQSRGVGSPRPSEKIAAVIKLAQRFSSDWLERVVGPGPCENKGEPSWRRPTGIHHACRRRLRRFTGPHCQLCPRVRSRANPNHPPPLAVSRYCV